MARLSAILCVFTVVLGACRGENTDGLNGAVQSEQQSPSLMTSAIPASMDLPSSLHTFESSCSKS